MLSYLENIIDLDQEQIGTIVHIGAGRCSELGIYLKAKPEKIVLVEAVPELAKALREKTTDIPQVEVVEQLITGDDSPAELTIYNDERFHSIKLSDSLKYQLKNLDPIGKAEVIQLPVSDLFSKCSLTDEKTNVLVVESFGNEYQLLNIIECTLFGYIALKTEVVSNVSETPLNCFDLIYKSKDCYIEERCFKRNTSLIDLEAVVSGLKSENSSLKNAKNELEDSLKQESANFIKSKNELERRLKTLELEKKTILSNQKEIKVGELFIDLDELSNNASECLCSLVSVGFFPVDSIDFNQGGKIRFRKHNLNNEILSKFIIDLPLDILVSTLNVTYECLGLVNETKKSDDFLASIDEVTLNKTYTPILKFVYCCFFFGEMLHEKNNLMAQNFLNLSKDFVSQEPATHRALTLLIAKLFNHIGRKNDAAMLIYGLFDGDELKLSEKELNSIFSSSYRDVKSSVKKNQHGHDLLLEYLESNKSSFAPNSLLIEVGTTREDVPGQGSTKQLSEFCFENGLEFITVDMDEHNGRVANNYFSLRQMKSSQAITQKGEDFLLEFDGEINYLFLDAYDFDHGMHSELRQSRYEKFLGDKISDEACHKMHLDCVVNSIDKLSENGVICIDDTWLEEGQWTAKGTLAVPYLLDNGFEIIEARNRAALLKRKILTMENI